MLPLGTQRVCLPRALARSCINCMHVLPDLAAIEQAYEGQPVTVVGVHSAKFQNEKDSEAIRNAGAKSVQSPSAVRLPLCCLWYVPLSAPALRHAG